ncbi:hypothetical protein [Fusobacterium sp.]|uniref:hypothetical protein n=2 Tax=Fusobacterium sp. TaxID=68766 RepID=UPI0025C2C259|nr:hypothetical protein [Fusobacterium sp.]
MRKFLCCFFIVFSLIMNKNSLAETQNSKKIITQTFLSYEKESGEKILAVSNYVIVDLKEIVAFEVENYFPVLNLEYGAEVNLPYKLRNYGNIEETYLIKIENYEIFSGFQIYFDSDKNGIIDENELPLKKIGEDLFETPTVEINNSFNFIIKGKLKNKLEINQLILKLKVESVTQREVLREVENTLNIYSKRKVDITKKIIYDPEKKQFFFTFKFLNESSKNLDIIYLEDNIDENFKLNHYLGLWQNFKGLEKKEVTFYIDGFEKNDPNIDVSLINNKLKVYIKNVPVQNINEIGGVLYIPFTVDSSLEEKKLLKNVAEYYYVLDSQNSIKYKTNEVVFFNKYVPKLEMTGDSNPTIKEEEDRYIYEFKNTIKNMGNSPDIFNVMVKNSNFPNEIVFLNLVDSNNDGIVDSSLLQPNETKEIIFRTYLKKDEIENKKYSLNLLFNSLKVEEYKVSNSNVLNLKETEVIFIKEQKKEGGKYTSDEIRIASNEKIYYRITLKNISKDVPLFIDEIYDRLPDNVILSEGDQGLNEGGKPVYQIGDSFFEEIDYRLEADILKIENIVIPPNEKITIFFNVDVK